MAGGEVYIHMEGMRSMRPILATWILWAGLTAGVWACRPASDRSAVSRSAAADPLSADGVSPERAPSAIRRRPLFAFDLLKPVELFSFGDGLTFGQERPSNIWRMNPSDRTYIYLGSDLVHRMPPSDLPSSSDPSLLLRFTPAGPPAAGDSVEYEGPIWLTGDQWPEQVRDLLQVGETYRVMAENMPGFPDTYGLLIYHGPRLLVHAATAWTHESFFGRGVSPISIEVGDREPGGAPTSSDCYESWWERQTRFSLGQEILVLSRGASGPLGPFHIQLNRSAEVHYTNLCLDSGVNELSFLAVRLVDSSTR